MNHISTVPFGGRLTVAQAGVQAKAAACPADATVSKWATLRAVTDARGRLGVSDRAVAVLHALLSFVPGETVAAGTVVFPSNATLSGRAHGMSAATLRRHLAQLVEAGLVIRRDSPNGKRYARRGEDGGVALAFGFELTPLVARAAEIDAAAAAVAAERRRLREARERHTLLRRDVAGLAALLVEAGAPQPVEPLPPVLPRSADAGAVEDALFDLGRRRSVLAKRLEDLMKSSESSASVDHRERHIQDSNPDPSDSEPHAERVRAVAAAPVPDPDGARPSASPPSDAGADSVPASMAGLSPPRPSSGDPAGLHGGADHRTGRRPDPGAGPKDRLNADRGIDRGVGRPAETGPGPQPSFRPGARPGPDRGSPRESAADGGSGSDGRSAPSAVRIDLAAVLAACPSLRDWSPSALRGWDDLVRVAETVRPALGISPDGWREAVGAMGESGAAVTLATILERADAIGSPGGYLRSLSAKAREGRFSPAPVVVSLLRRRTRLAAEARGG